MVVADDDRLFPVKDEPQWLNFYRNTSWLWLAYTSLRWCTLCLLINLIAVGALFFIWLERKVAGRIQDRLGPTRVGGKFGWLQTLADGLKLITKEDLMPEGADEFLFRIAPYVSFCASFTALHCPALCR